MRAIINAGELVFSLLHLSDATTLIQDANGWLVTDGSHQVYIGNPQQPELVINSTGAPSDAGADCFSIVAGVITYSAAQYAVDQAAKQKPVQAALQGIAITNFQAAQQRKATALLKKGSLQAALKVKGII